MGSAIWGLKEGFEKGANPSAPMRLLISKRESLLKLVQFVDDEFKANGIVKSSLDLLPASSFVSGTSSRPMIPLRGV